jgi:hypothetical protein
MLKRIRYFAFILFVGTVVFNLSRPVHAVSPVIWGEVSFQTEVSGQYVTVPNCEEHPGTYPVRADADSIGDCETFNLWDLDAGTLEDEDEVAVQMTTGDLEYFSTYSGGNPLMAEDDAIYASITRFFIFKNDEECLHPCGDLVDGDVVELQSEYNGYYWTAIYGGGDYVYCNIVTEPHSAEKFRMIVD